MPNELDVKSLPLFELQHAAIDPRLTAISQELSVHYAAAFERHGATGKGLDWGREDDVLLRYDKMLAVIEPPARDAAKRFSLLDVGCGYGGLYRHAVSRGLELEHTGIDLAENMISHAQGNIPEGRFLAADVLRLSPRRRSSSGQTCAASSTRCLMFRRLSDAVRWNESRNSSRVNGNILT